MNTISSQLRCTNTIDSAADSSRQMCTIAHHHSCCLIQYTQTSLTRSIAFPCEYSITIGGWCVCCCSLGVCWVAAVPSLAPLPLAAAAAAAAAMDDDDSAEAADG